MLLMFSNIEITPKFSSHNFSHNRKIYRIRKLLTKFRFKEGFTPKHWWNEVGISMFATQKVSCILSVWRATESHQINENSSVFLNCNFQSICPHQISLLVLTTILTHINLQLKKICQKCLLCHFYLTGIFYSEL